MENQAAWLSALLKSQTERVTSPLGDTLPDFPPAEMQLHTVGLSGDDAIHEAYTFSESCKEYFRTSRLWSNEGKNIIDFGTGWGRIARCFLSDFRAEKITGLDNGMTFLSKARENFPDANFHLTNALPPINSAENDHYHVEAESIDFIVGYSVFSHLSEEAFEKWMNEFSRVLRSGGMVAVTTRGRWFFDTAEGLKGMQLEGYAKGLSEMFADFDEARERYDSGQFIHVTNSLIGDGMHYGETFIPKAYLNSHLPSSLKLVSFHENEGQHPIIVLKKL
jgi:SAM-dependent methyltransferase